MAGERGKRYVNMERQCGRERARGLMKGGTVGRGMNKQVVRSCNHTHLGFGRDKRLQHFTHSSIVSLQVLQGGWGEVMRRGGRL